MIAENNSMEDGATLILWSICAAQVYFCQRQPRINLNGLRNWFPHTLQSITKMFFSPTNPAPTGLIVL